MKRPPQLSLLVTTDSKGHCCTRDNTVPWYHHPGRRLLEQQVRGCPVLIGRRTFECITHSLPGAHWLVLSKTLERNQFGVWTVRNVREALIASRHALEVFAYGGWSLYETLFPLSESIYWLEIYRPLNTWDTARRFFSLDHTWKARVMAKAREYKLWKFTRDVL